MGNFQYKFNLEDKTIFLKTRENNVLYSKNANTLSETTH